MLPILIVPLGLSGALFSTMAVFTRYQWIFAGFSIAIILLAHGLSWPRRKVLSRFHFVMLWVSTVITTVSVMVALYSWGYFSWITFS